MLLLSTLKKVLELCFVLDHYNYARWLSVFVQDLEVAYGDNPELFSQLSSHLSVTTTNAKFSRIAYDHKHENNNKCIQSTSGYKYINLVNKEDKSYLRKLEICLPEILPYLESCEGKVMKNHKHKQCATGSKFLTEPDMIGINLAGTGPEPVRITSQNNLTGFDRIGRINRFGRILKL